MRVFSPNVVFMLMSQKSKNNLLLQIEMTANQDQKIKRQAHKLFSNALSK